MFNKINNLVSYFIVLILLFGLTKPSFSAEDFTAYKNSTYSKPVFDSFVEEGFNAFDRQDTASAIDFLKKATGSGCTSPIVYFKLALSFEAQGSYYSAIQYYELARDQFALSKEPHRYRDEFDENYGRALYMMGQISKAMPLLEKSAKTTKNFWIFNLLAQEALQQGDYLKAINYLEQGLNLNDPNLTVADRVHFYTQIARIYANKNQESGAMTYYSKVTELDPQNQEAKRYLANNKKFEIDHTVEDKVYEILERN